MKLVRYHALVASFVLVTGCGSDDALVPAVGSTFTVQVGSDQFFVRAVDEATIAKLEARRHSGVEGVIIGRVAKGDGGFNSPWTWHLVPSTVDVVDLSIELCDGTPSYVEAHRDEWISTVRDYCPWGAKVVATRQ
jgi:hypothetical protein